MPNFVGMSYGMNELSQGISNMANMYLQSQQMQRQATQDALNNELKKLQIQEAKDELKRRKTTLDKIETLSKYGIPTYDVTLPQMEQSPQMGDSMPQGRQQPSLQGIQGINAMPMPQQEQQPRLTQGMRPASPMDYLNVAAAAGDPNLMKEYGYVAQVANENDPQRQRIKMKFDAAKNVYEQIVKSGNNDAMKQFMSGINKDPDLKNTFSFLDSIELPAAGEEKVTATLDKSHLKALSGMAASPMLADLIASSDEGMYQYEKKGGKIVAFQSKDKPDKETSAEMQSKVFDIGTRLRLKQPVTAEEKALYDEYYKNKTAAAQTYGGIRLQIARETPYDVYNPEDQSFSKVLRKDIIENPGKYASASQGIKAQAKNAIFDEITASSNQMRDAVKNIKFSESQLAKFSNVLKTHDNGSAIGNFLNSNIGKTLTPDEISYVTAVKNLRESAYALRVAGGAGAQSSDMLRNAIDDMVPSAKTPSKEYALRALDRFDMQTRILKSGVAQPGKANATGKPTLKEFLKKAMPLNPKTSQKDLTDYYNQKYGEGQ